MTTSTKEQLKKKKFFVYGYQILPVENLNNNGFVEETTVRNYLNWLKEINLKKAIQDYLSIENNAKSFFFDSNSGESITLEKCHELDDPDLIGLEFELNRKYALPKIIIKNEEQNLGQGDKLSESWTCIINIKTGICLFESNKYFGANRIGLYLRNKIGPSLVFKNIANSKKIDELEKATSYSYLSYKVQTINSHLPISGLSEEIKRLGLIMRADEVKCIFRRKSKNNISLSKSRFKDYIKGVRASIDENSYLSANFEVKYRLPGKKRNDVIKLNRIIYIFESIVPYKHNSSYNVNLHLRSLSNIYNEHHQIIQEDIFPKIDLKSTLSKLYK